MQTKKVASTSKAQQANFTIPHFSENHTQNNPAHSVSDNKTLPGAFVHSVSVKR